MDLSSMRARGTNLSEGTRIKATVTRSNGPNLYTNDSTPGTTGSIKSVWDVVHRGYAKAVRDGNVVLGDFKMTRSERRYSDMSLITSVPKDYNYCATWSGDCAAFVEALYPPDLSLRNDVGSMQAVALTNAYAKLRDGSIVSGEVIREIGSTVQSLTHPFRTARNVLAEMALGIERRGKKGVRRSRAMRDAWLEYRYALKPAMLDMVSIVKNVSSLYDRTFNRRLVVRAGQVRKRNTSRSFTAAPLVNYYAGWLVSGSVTTTHQISCNAGVICTVQRTLSDTLLSDFGMDGGAALATAWELTPFSFVADWFVNVGPWLNAIAPPPGITPMGNWVTTVDETSSTYVNGLLNNTGYRDGTAPNLGSWGGSTVKSVEVTRETGVDLPTPVALANWASVTHAVDAAALSLEPILKVIKRLRK